MDLTCASCHTDYHQGQFLASSVSERSKRGARDPARGCDLCHRTTRFKDSTFAHNDAAFSSYPLDGRHERVACAKCHPTVRVAEGVETVRYRPLPRLCEACHADFHHGEFRGFEPGAER